MAVTRATYARAVTYTVRETTGAGPTGRGYLDERSACRSDKRYWSTRLGSQTEARSHVDARPRVTECASCGVEMVVQHSAARGMHYLVCPRCKARFASNYTEVFSAQAGVRTRAVHEEPAVEPEKWKRLRERAEAFHRKVDESDPYQVLGLCAGVPFSDVRARFHDLASRHHPDHGGDASTMRRMIEAYERIRAMLASRAVAEERER